MENSLVYTKTFFALVSFVFIFFMYFLFPTNNSSLDAYAYASYVKYNQSLFTPHHLLYNPLIKLVYEFLKYLKINVDVLFLGKIVNSFFQLFNLVIFYKILSSLNISKTKSILYILILGFSFSLWRYGTENEMYIVPISFSLLSSYYFLKAEIKFNNKYILFSGLFGATACLFHQVHFFWWFGILIGVVLKFKKIKTVIIYIIPAFVVPLVYTLVLVFYEHKSLNFYNFIHFIFHDFYNGNVTNNFGLKVVLLQIVNSIRVFFQVHPIVYQVLIKKQIFIIPLVTSLFLIFYIGRQLSRNQIIREKSNFQLFSFVHLGIFSANYLFAFYSSGNVEFMVLLPFLLLIYIVLSYSVNSRILLNLSVLLFIWNFFFGILPNHILSLQKDSKLVDYIEKHPQNIYIVKNEKVKNQYFYRSGIDYFENIIGYNKVNKELIDSILNKQNFFYTDFIDKPVIYNRSRFVDESSIYSFKKLIDRYAKEIEFKYREFYGVSKVYKVSKKD